MCQREIALMRRLDARGAIDFVDVSGEKGDAGGASCPIDREKLLERFHASENGHLHEGAAAFAAMWRAIPVLRPLGLAARWKPLLGLLEIAYRGFLKVRPALQKLVS